MRGEKVNFGNGLLVRHGGVGCARTLESFSLRKQQRSLWLLLWS